MGTRGSHRLDLEAEKNGIWRNFGGIEFLLAPMNSARHKERILEIAKSRGILEEGATDVDRATRVEMFTDIAVEAMAGTVVLNWRNYQDEDEDGNPLFEDEAKKVPACVPYSDERCIQDLTNPEFRLWLEWVERVTGDATNYTRRAVGNSSRSSSGGRTEAANAS